MGEGSAEARSPRGSAKLRFFFGHKMGPKCCYFGLDLGP